MLAIAGGKGGCGKTTTAVGLATAFAAAGRSPLVADADHEMPDLHLLTEVEPRTGLDALADGRRVEAVARTARSWPGVSVVPAGGVDGNDVQVALERLRRWPGPVLVDCPAGAARDAARPLRVADRSLLVTGATAASVTDAVKTAAMARELDAPPVGAVVVETTPADTGGDPDRSVSRARATLNCSILGYVPNVPGDTVADDRVRTAYRAVAKKVLGRNI